MMHTGGGRGGRGDKSVPSLQIFAKLVNKNAIKHQKGVPSPKNFHNPYILSLTNLTKTSWTLPQDFQTMCIYEDKQDEVVLSNNLPSKIFFGIFPSNVKFL
jgi:hypothetical protein